jgi:hypothetical protein
MHYVCTCGSAVFGAKGGGDNEQSLSAVAHVILTCDMYKSSLTHIHDPVLSSLKMKGICFFFYRCGCDTWSVTLRVDCILGLGTLLISP